MLSYCFWDKDSRQRLKPFAASEYTLPNNTTERLSITSCIFNASGTIFAYAASYDWSQGAERAPAPGQNNHIMLHSLASAAAQKDIAPKAKR
jgi:mRNA export factor